MLKISLLGQRNQKLEALLTFLSIFKLLIFQREISLTNAYTQ